MKKFLTLLVTSAFAVLAILPTSTFATPLKMEISDTGALQLPSDGEGLRGLRIPQEVVVDPADPKQGIIGIEKNTTAIGAVVKWTNFALGFVAVIAIAFIIYGGFLAIMSGDDEGGVKKATTIIKNAIVGIIVIISAYAIVNTLLA